MLKPICIQNFKAFGEPLVQLPLSKVTMVLGPNGSGKTSILDALGLLSQTAARQGSQEGFQWEGNWVNFSPDGRAATHRGNLDADLALGVSIEAGLEAQSWYSENTSGNLEPPKKIEYPVSNIPHSRKWRHVCTVDEQLQAVNEYPATSGSQPTLTFRVPTNDQYLQSGADE